MAWSRPVIKGTPPSARWGHTSDYIGENKILIYGGHDGTKMLNDLHILDIESLTWTQIQAKGEGEEKITARAAHSSTLFQEKLLIFGGGDGHKILNDSWVLDLKTFTFHKLVISGSSPPGRCAHSSTLVNDKFILYAGGDGSRRFKDLYIVDLGLLT
jgi:hypothetical protein